MSIRAQGIRCDSLRWLVVLCLLSLATRALSRMSASVAFSVPSSFGTTKGAGFVVGSSCNPFALPKVKRYISLTPTRRNGLTGMGPGYCLCDDDDGKTIIASPKGCGSEPVICGKLCAEQPLKAEKNRPCQKQARVECDEPNVRKKALSTPKKVFQLAQRLASEVNPHLGAKLPSGSRRDLYKDFVMHDRRLPKSDAERVKLRILKFLRDAPEYPADQIFEGRGIVIVGGTSPKFATSFWVAAHAVRRTGSNLPIEVWFPGGELPSCMQIAELENLRVHVRSFTDFENIGIGVSENTNRFMFKIIALMFSAFDEVLLLDADNIVLRDPDNIFHWESYLSTGSLMWKDFWQGSSAPDCQEVLGNSTALLHTHESGQVVVKKSSTWTALSLALFMNAHSYFFYPLTVNYM